MDLAVELASALRAFGVPVWHDQSDLPPGDTNRRLKEALDSGLSGAMLLVTPEMAKSQVVKEIELPSLADLQENSTFIFAIANAIMCDDLSDRIDFDAPDRVLKPSHPKLSGIKQFRVGGREAAIAIAKAICLQRMAALRPNTTETLDLHIQTRLDPRADHETADLIVRLPSPAADRRSPPARAWPYYSAFLNWLPQLTAELGVTELRARGGAHLSAAYALGAALPSTSGHAVSVLDVQGRIWRPINNARPIPLRETRESQMGIDGCAAVFVDLVGTPQPVDTFGSHFRDPRHRYSRAMRITQPSSAQVPATSGAATAADIANRIRLFAAEARTSKLDLFLRTPFPLTVLLGCQLNTIEVRLHEWEDGGVSPPEYRPSIRVASGRGSSPIIKIEDAEAGET